MYVSFVSLFRFGYFFLTPLLLATYFIIIS